MLPVLTATAARLRRSSVRVWLETPAANRPSLRWAAIVATALGLWLTLAQSLALMGEDESPGKQPDGNAWRNQEHRYGDFALFVRAGKAILSGDLDHAYSDATVQTGPLALVWAGTLALVLHALNASSTIGYGITAIAALVPAVYAVALWAARHRPTRWLYLATIGAAIVLIIPWQLHDLFALQHPTYLWVPALWLIAANHARLDRPVPTAFLLATACGLETWGVLAVPVILLTLGTWNSRARAAVVVIVITGLLWAPFALSRDFAMLDVTWVNSLPSPVGALLGNPDAITWQVRAVQAVTIVAASVIAWHFGRTATGGVTVGVAVVAWARVMTDTQFYPYYRLPLFVTTAAIVLATSAHYLRTRRRRDLAALGVSGVMISVAQAEALTFSLAVSAGIHILVLAGLVASIRSVPDAYGNADPGDAGTHVKPAGSPPRSPR